MALAFGRFVSAARLRAAGRFIATCEDYGEVSGLGHFRSSIKGLGFRGLGLRVQDVKLGFGA